LQLWEYPTKGLANLCESECELPHIASEQTLFKLLVAAPKVWNLIAPPANPQKWPTDIEARRVASWQPEKRILGRLWRPQNLQLNRMRKLRQKCLMSMTWSSRE
jgi:hypothetical protein